MAEPEESPGGLHGNEPSPEQVFDGSKVTVHLTDFNRDPNVKIRVLMGIRAVLSALHGEKVRLSAAARIYASPMPVLLGHADGAELASAAAAAGQKASGKNLVLGVGLDAADLRGVTAQGPQEPEEPAPLPQVEDTEEDPAIGTTAAKVALVLMAMNEGSPTRSYTFAKILRKDTGDSLWADAADLIDKSFPNVMGEDVSG
jgi:pimeloyl-ACP methyl ester carboxylesterase